MLIPNCLFYGGELSCNVNGGARGRDGAAAVFRRHGGKLGSPNTSQTPNFVKFNNATISNRSMTKYSNEILFEVRNVIQI